MSSLHAAVTITILAWAGCAYVSGERWISSPCASSRRTLEQYLMRHSFGL
jgi:hypothetical protein